MQTWSSHSAFAGSAGLNTSLRSGLKKFLPSALPCFRDPSIPPNASAKIPLGVSPHLRVFADCR